MVNRGRVTTLKNGKTPARFKRPRVTAPAGSSGRCAWMHNGGKLLPASNARWNRREAAEVAHKSSGSG